MGEGKEMRSLEPSRKLEDSIKTSNKAAPPRLKLLLRSLTQTTYPGHSICRQDSSKNITPLSKPQGHVFFYLTKPAPPTLSPAYKTDNRVQIKAKNGLPSIDRNNKATLLFTGPCRTTKSYAKDLSPRIVKLQDVS